MKILYVITGLGLGGAEKFVISLAEELYQNSHEIKIAYLTGKVRLIPKYKDIELIPLELNSFRDIFTSFNNYVKLLKSFQPDIVHAHMVHANIFTRIGRLFQPVPKLISTAHNSNEGGMYRMLAYRLTHYLSDITTNVSRQAVLDFEYRKAVPKNSMLSIYNGVNTRKFSNLNIDKKGFLEKLGLNSQKKILLAVGRLEEQKDYPNLIRALSILKESNILNLQLIIVGDGSLRNRIEDLIKSLNLSHEVKLLGNRYDIPELMNIADIYILSSKFEGLPTVLIEAMACEKFIVATDCGGSAEILGDTGILVAAQDSLALAQAIEQALVLSEQEINENGKRARKRVEDLFSLESCVSKWLELYGK